MLNCNACNCYRSFTLSCASVELKTIKSKFNAGLKICNWLLKYLFICLKPQFCKIVNTPASLFNTTERRTNLPINLKELLFSAGND